MQPALDKIYTDTVASPVGALGVSVDAAGALVGIEFHADRCEPLPQAIRDARRCRRVTQQIAEYFARKRTRFELELRFPGTAFQRLVWKALCDIPFGKTMSYGELARAIGKPNAVRAVGRANGANPIPIVVPCHRVIGADGSLTGFGGGLAIKRALLGFEADE